MGTLIYNKWQDKSTGEDRKILKLRILEILSREDVERLGLDEHFDRTPKRSRNDYSDMYQESPEMYDQVPDSERLRRDVWPDPLPPAKRTVRENVNGDFDGFDDDDGDRLDPRIPF